MTNSQQYATTTYRAVRQSGFTVIELLVALTIALFVLSGLSYILVESHKSGRVQAGIQDLQEYGRYAIETLSRDIRGAGYMGCSEGANFTNNLDMAFAGLGLPPRVKGFEYSTTGVDRSWYPSDGSDPALPTSEEAALQSDSFVLTFASATNYKTTASTEGSPSVSLNSVDGIETGMFLYIGNCESIDLFQVTAVDEDDDEIEHTMSEDVSPGNVADILGGTYETGDELLTFSTVRYFVSTDSDITDPNGNLIPTLFRGSTAGTTPDPLVVGVENMQVRYGEDTGGTPAADTYVQADDVSNWNNVRTMQISLLLRSEQEYGTSPAEISGIDYQILDVGLSHGSSRLRKRVFSTTVDIRNGY